MIKLDFFYLDPCTSQNSTHSVLVNTIHVCYVSRKITVLQNSVYVLIEDLKNFISSEHSICTAFELNAVIGSLSTEFTWRTAVSIQFQSWDLVLTNYLLTVSHLGSDLDITTVILLLLDITLDITWNHEWLLLAHVLLYSLLLLCFLLFFGE